MKRIVIPVAGLVTGLWLSTAAALGLGEIQVRSHLNQRFEAVIPLTSTTADEAANLRVSLAGADEFTRVGIERSDYLSSLRFAVRSDGTPRIEIRSEQIAREPYVQLLLDIRGAGGSRMLRQYTVLLDPPEFADSAASRSNRPAPIVDAEPVEATAVAPVEFVPPPVKTAPAKAAPSKPAKRQAAAPAAEAAPSEAPVAAAITTNPGELYGPVKSAETLWSIATRMRPSPDITMDQVLLAIFNGNPRSFDGGSINGLQKGAMLRVPSAADMQSTSAADAKAEVARLRGLPVSSTRSASTAPRRPQIEPAEIAPPPPPTQAAATPAPAAKPVEPKAVEPKPAPATKPTPPPAEKPATAAAAPTPAPVPATPSQAPAATGDATAAASAPATAPETAPAESAAAPAAPAETPAAEAAPSPKPAAPPPPPREEDGLLETLLIPLVLGLLLLGCIGYLFSRWRQRRGAASAPTPPPLPPSGGRRSMPLSTPSAGKMAAAAGVAAAAAAPKLSAQQELDRLQETLDGSVSEAEIASTQQLKTQQLDVPPLDVPATPVASAALPPVDFDLTGQFAAQTVQIDLDANDPVSEADFHLAYGLYDEAALLLTQAAAKDPARTDIAVKLAETYFAAGKVGEFEQTAAGLKGKLPAAEWQKLAIMGQQLNPSSSLFADASGSALETDLDLGFDADSAPSFETPSAPPATSSAPTFDKPSATLDFQLDDLELSSLDAGKLDEPKADHGNALDFDLGEFDMGQSAAPAAPTPAAAPAADRGNSLDFDLSGFDLDPAPAAKPAVPAPQSAPAVEDIRLDEFDFDAVPTDSGEISGDEAGTKLDLARAYVDMGDNEMARGLLNEVLQQGSGAQQQEARDLLGRLG